MTGSSEALAQVSCGPKAVFIIPTYNSESALRRCAISALRQQGVDIRLIVVDHGSEDSTVSIARMLAADDARVSVIRLMRLPDDHRNPARPLNVGLRAAIALSLGSERWWAFRLDADDVVAGDHVVAKHLRVGYYRALIGATLVFFNQRHHYAYEYGPWPGHRNLNELRCRSVYTAAHHASAMRCDLLSRVARNGRAYMDEDLDYGEDLGLTCLLLRAITHQQWAFVDSPYCFTF